MNKRQEELLTLINNVIFLYTSIDDKTSLLLKEVIDVLNTVYFGVVSTKINMDKLKDNDNYGTIVEE